MMNCRLDTRIRQTLNRCLLAGALAPNIWLFICGISGIHTAASDPVRITRGVADISLPLESSENLPARYGMGFPLQVSATEAALFCNLRVIAPGMFDYEDGTDVLIFDSTSALRTAKPIAISRNQKRSDAETGKTRLLVKFPVAGGFWPAGAKMDDGSRHPGEGKGFGFCQALSFETDEKSLHVFKWTQSFVRYVEMLQVSYDGTRFEVAARELAGSAALPTADGKEWQLVSPGLTNAIPSGADLLQPVLARRDGESRSGVCRWRWQDGKWTAVSFGPVGLGSEPSLVRLSDCSLMFAVRLGGDQSETVVVWRSDEAGEAWREVVRQADARGSSPVSIHRTVCGIPLIGSNPLGPKRLRTKLCLWTVNGSSLIDPRLIRDCIEEFGRLPRETFWCVDHPSSAIVRLADGQWHALLTYRIKAYHLPTRMREEPVLPQTGCYVEEILSDGPPVPEWQF